MDDVTPALLANLAVAVQAGQTTTTPAPRLFSIWEITSWILPMAPEHFRRVLAAAPHLPQGTAGAEGGTRRFTATDLTALRHHFASGPRQARYQPPRLPGSPAPVVAPIVALTGPMGATGRTTSLLHLAVGAALCGYRILVIESDPAGTTDLAPATGQGALSLMARSAAEHLRRLNEARLDRGDAPQPMDEALAAALGLTVDDLIQPTLWPGLDVMAMSPAALQGDLLIAGWRQRLRGWHPGPALGLALNQAGLRQRYDLILCDTARGLGPLAMALLTSADMLLAPLPLQEGALGRLGTGLAELAAASALMQAEAQGAARALGQTAPGQVWQRLWVLPIRAGADAPQRMAGFVAKLGGKLGAALLPTPLPEVEAVATGQVPHLYDLDYRRMGRLTYAPLRQACDAACQATIQALTGFAAKPIPASG